MTDLRKLRRGNPWRDHLTPEEAAELEHIDALLARLRKRARLLSFDRIKIQNRATVRARNAR